MSNIILNKDFRSAKAKNALYIAMFSLLKSTSFRKITIKRVCEEALISRAAFYAHFIDKYDLLKHWMAEFWPTGFNSNDTYDHIEKEINYLIIENKLILENLVYEADAETLDVLFDFILSTLGISIEKNTCGEMYPKNIVLANFYAGGMISYILWQVKNKFPSEVPPMNIYLYEMIHGLQGYNAR